MRKGICKPRTWYGGNESRQCIWRPRKRLYGAWIQVSDCTGSYSLSLGRRSLYIKWLKTTEITDRVGPGPLSKAHVTLHHCIVPPIVFSSAKLSQAFDLLLLNSAHHFLYLCSNANQYHPFSSPHFPTNPKKKKGQGKMEIVCNYMGRQGCPQHHPLKQDQGGILLTMRSLLLIAPA